MGVSKPACASWRDWLVSGVTPAPATPSEAWALLAGAKTHGLLGLLASETGVLRALPDAVRADWGRAARVLFARGVHQLDLAGGLLRRLDARGIRALPLKGAAVAEVLYDSPADRHMADVDLLVLDDLGAAVRVLEAEGFHEVERADHALALRHVPTGAIVELHRSLTSCPGLFAHDAPGLWARREAGGGLVPWRPAVADLLVQLSLHAAFQHGLVLRLVQFLDFRRLFERLSPDPEEVLEAAAYGRAEGALLLALTAARAVVGVDVEPVLEEALRARVKGAVRALARTLAESDPLLFLSPERPALLRVRWALASGRRADFVRRTLWPAAWPGERERTPLLPWRRAGRLLARHAAWRRVVASPRQA